MNFLAYLTDPTHSLNATGGWNGWTDGWNRPHPESVSRAKTKKFSRLRVEPARLTDE
jgi:hypothetical protein